MPREQPPALRAAGSVAGCPQSGRPCERSARHSRRSGHQVVPTGSACPKRSCSGHPALPDVGSARVASHRESSGLPRPHHWPDPAREASRRLPQGRGQLRRRLLRPRDVRSCSPRLLPRPPWKATRRGQCRPWPRAATGTPPRRRSLEYCRASPQPQPNGRRPLPRWYRLLGAWSEMGAGPNLQAPSLRLYMRQTPYMRLSDHAPSQRALALSARRRADKLQ